MILRNLRHSILCSAVVLASGALQAQHGEKSSSKKESNPGIASKPDSRAAGQVPNREILKKHWPLGKHFSVQQVKGDKTGNFCGYRFGEVVKMDFTKDGGLEVNAVDPNRSVIPAVSETHGVTGTLSGTSLWIDAVDSSGGLRDGWGDARYKTKISPTKIWHESATKVAGVLRKYGTTLEMEKRDDGSIFVKVNRKNAQGGGTYSSTCVLEPVK